MKSSVSGLALQRRILLAGSIGPLGQAAQEECTLEEAADILAEQAHALIEAGADFLIFETLPDRKAALSASMTMALLPEGTPFVLSHDSRRRRDCQLVAHRLQKENPICEPFALG